MRRLRIYRICIVKWVLYWCFYCCLFQCFQYLLFYSFFFLAVITLCIYIFFVLQNIYFSLTLNWCWNDGVFKWCGESQVSREERKNKRNKAHELKLVLCNVSLFNVFIASQWCSFSCSFCSVCDKTKCFVDWCWLFACSLVCLLAHSFACLILTVWFVGSLAMRAIAVSRVQSNLKAHQKCFQVKTT